MGLLNDVRCSENVKKLTEKEAVTLCSELRGFLVREIPKTGGHLASNLGAVELTVAMHRVFDCPSDHFIFDVGHQAYVHKILTGRRERFFTLRKPGGLSGFTTRREGEADAFGAGHSSTSLSAALGFAEADKLLGRDDYTVCVIGDGAYTGGMIHEALNNCKKNLKLVIILNENGMCISPNKGAFAKLFAKLRVYAPYHRFKGNVKAALLKIPRVGKGLVRVLSKTRDAIRKAIYPMNYFEQLGMYYIGPVDGNDYHAVERALANAKALGSCVVVHVRTKKGYGYPPAELSPETFHSIKTDAPVETFHSVFAKELHAAAALDSRIAVVTAAMGIGTGMKSFETAYPDRYFDVGIAEEHALTFSAGLAAAGMKPYAVIYSTFLQRGYDNIVHDVALQNLPVRLIIDRTGLSLGDGATHHGIFDVAFLSGIPGMTIYAPATFDSLKRAILASLSMDTPVAIRYPDATEDPRVFARFHGDSFGISADFDLSAKPENVIVTYGTMVSRALDAEAILESRGIGAGVVLLESLAPYEKTAERLIPYLKDARHILFAEEGIENGGASMILRTLLSDRNAFADGARTETAAIGDFAVPAELCDLYDHVGLSAEKLASHFES